MSSHESLDQELDHLPKPKIQRRHGACEPCRSSKTKCDGRTPCGACRSERRKQCPCVYSDKARKLQEVTAETRRRAESERRNCEESSKPLPGEEAPRPLGDDYRELATQSWSEDAVEMTASQSRWGQSDSGSEVESARMLHPLSVCGAIEEFKRLKPARGFSAQVISRCSGFEAYTPFAPNRDVKDKPQSDMAISSPQPSSVFSASQEPSEVASLERTLAAVDRLIKEGRLTQAWIDLAGVVREAQLAQASDTTGQPPSGSPRWTRVWNTVLDLEAQIGLTMGHPTGVFLPTPGQSKPSNGSLSLEDSLDETRIDLCHHIQGVLTLDITHVRAIRDFLERAQDTIMHEPFTRISLCTTVDHSAAVRDLHLDTHMLLMVIYCRMANLCDMFSRDLTNTSWSGTPAADIIKQLNLHQPRQKLTYCRKMFRSAEFILETFIGLHQDDAELTGRDWLRCHSAYAAAVILGIAKLRYEVEWHATTNQLKQLEQIFATLSQRNPHCLLFSSAVERLRDLDSIEEPASEPLRNKHNRNKTRNRGPTSSADASPEAQNQRTLGVDLSSLSASSMVSNKRPIDMVDGPTANKAVCREGVMRESVRDTSEFQSQSQAHPEFEDLDLGPLSYFQDNSADYSQSNSSYTTASATSSATSFSESDMPLQAVAGISLNHPGPPFAYPFPYTSFHPPMIWNNPLYTVADHNNMALSLQIPMQPQYSSGASSIACDVGPQHALYDTSNSHPSTSGSHLSSPLQPSSDGTITSAITSPTVQADAVFRTKLGTSQTMPDHSGNNRALSQHNRPPLPSNGNPDASGRPSLERSSSMDTIYQSPPPTAQEHPEPLSMSWHPSSITSVLHPMAPQTHNTGATGPDMGRRASAGDVRAFPGHHHRQDSGFSLPVTQPPPSSHVLNVQYLPHNQNTYMPPTSGMYPPSQYPVQYQHGNIPPGPKYHVPDSGQLRDQWQRMSIGTGPATGPRY